MIREKSAHAGTPWEVGIKYQGIRNSKKEKQTKTKTHTETYILGTAWKEMRVTKKETMNAWIGKEMWTTFTVEGVVKAL